MKTISFFGNLEGLTYCPNCKKVYYQKEECNFCDEGKRKE